MSFIRASRRATAALAAASGVLALGALSSSAEAAFTTGKCAGDEITGSGATFQNNAHRLFWVGKNPGQALGEYCGAGQGPTVTYNNTAGLDGSGYGRRVMGERTGDNADGAKGRTFAERFGGTDEPPGTTQVNDMNRGSDATGDEARVRVIPAAVGALAVIVNLPSTGGVPCDTSTVPASRFSDPADVNRRRLRLTGIEVEKIFAGDDDVDTWGELLGPNLGGPAGDCANKPVLRIRRLDDSGSTFVFKDYLDKQGAAGQARGWKTTYLTPDTRTWPEPSTNLLAPATSGGGALRNAVRDNDGSISYLELGTARSGNTFERQATATDDTYWVQTTNGSAQFLDPNDNADGFVAATPTSQRGAKCSNAQVNGVPGGDEPTFGDWSGASAVNSTTSGVYGICSLTYLLAFDDNAAAYGASATEERKARSVFDYLTALTAESAQRSVPGTGLLAQDQAPLPSSLQQIAATGVSRISFNKAGSGSTTTPVTSNPGTTTTTPPSGGGGGPAPIVRPSNVFTITSARVSGRTVLVSVRLPGAGTLQGLATARYKGKALQLGKVTSTASRSGTVRLTFKMSKRYLQGLRRAKRLRTSIRITFTPVGGTANAGTRILTVKTAKKKKS